MTDLWPIPAVFAAGFLTEVVYVSYVRACVAGQSVRASLLCAVLVALGLLATAMFVIMTWFLALPAIAGHSIGTWVAVRYGVARPT